MDRQLLQRLQTVVGRLSVDPGGGTAAGISLSVGEHFVFRDDAVLWTVQTRRTQYRSGQGSLRVPIFGGMSVRVGGTRGASERELPSAEAADSGVVLLTDHRLLFLGSTRTEELPLRRLLGASIDPAQGHLVVHVQGRKNPVILQSTRAGPDELAAHLWLAELVSAHGVDTALVQLGSSMPPRLPSAASGEQSPNRRPMIKMRPQLPSDDT